MQVTLYKNNLQVIRSWVKGIWVHLIVILKVRIL